jgi:hypothetical protein
MSKTFDPYHRWLGIAPAQQPANHYRLLGLEEFESDADVIESAADRQMTHVRSFQAGQHAADSQRILNEIARAKLTLLSAKEKAAYDASLRLGTRVETAEEIESVVVEHLDVEDDADLTISTEISEPSAAETPRPVPKQENAPAVPLIRAEPKKRTNPKQQSPNAVLIAGGSAAAVVVLLLLVLIIWQPWSSIASDSDGTKASNRESNSGSQNRFQVDAQTLEISASDIAGTAVGQIEVSGAPANKSLQYAIVGGNTDGRFAVNVNTGRITLAKPFTERSETVASLSLRVSVKDPKAGNASSAVGTITINVKPGATSDTLPVELSQLEKGLLAHWQFNEGSGQTTKDSVSSYEGKLMADAAWGVGFGGYAVSLDGVGDYVALGRPAALEFVGDVTVSAWIKLNPDFEKELGFNVFFNVVSHGYTTSPPRSLELRIHDHNYQAQSWLGTHQEVEAAIPQEDFGAWVHLAATHDGAAWRLYRNGKLVGKHDRKEGKVEVDSDWAVGAHGNGKERFFPGLIDEVRIYNRALNPAEVALLHSSSGTPPTEQTDPLAGDPIPSNPASPDRKPVPLQADRDAAIAEVAEVFDFEAASTAEQKAELATLLMELAEDSRSSPAEYFVMLNLARENYAAAAKVKLAFAAIEKLEAEFSFNELQLKLITLGETIAANVPVAEKTEILSPGIALLDELFAEDEFESAEKLVLSLMDIARRNRDQTALDQLVDQRKKLNVLAARYAKVQADLAKLEEDPNDSAAHLRVGKYYLFDKVDWPRALPYLSKGGDDPLALAAADDLSGPTSAAAQLKVADFWFDLGQLEAEPEQQKILQSRALAWYRKAEPAANGLDAAKCKQRIDDLKAEGVEAARLE